MAETCVGTRALGPGMRSVVWVQGCPLDCAGCLAPEWIPDRPARRVEPADLVAELLADPRVTGLTFSGGEPMTQAAGLAETARLARRVRPGLTLLCFTGFRLDGLRARPADDPVHALLAETDVLVDGPYVAARNDDRGLRGSANQRVHHLTGRLLDAAAELAEGPRRIEIRVRDGATLFVGVPSRALAAAYPPPASSSNVPASGSAPPAGPFRTGPGPVDGGPPATQGEEANAPAARHVQGGGDGRSGERAEAEGSSR